MTKILDEDCHYTIDSYPTCCRLCPFIISYNYQCHNESGIAYDCRLGYMRNSDTRDFAVDRLRWKDCQIENNCRIKCTGF